MPLPPQPLACYSSLGPFREWFRHGTPILMYHKLGPRPRGARLKGLYVGNRLFQKQLSEFNRAGFRTPAYPGLDPYGDGDPHRRVVLTFDDGFENVLRHGLKPLAAAGFRAIQFLVADRLGKTNDWETREGEVEERLMDRGQVEEWLAAGHDIGSHTRTHPHLTRLSPAEAREEISGARKRLEDLFSRPIRHFCYPYGDHDDRTVDLVREAGYETACTTQSGLVQPDDDPFRLKRITVRYPSRKLDSLWRQLRVRVWPPARMNSQSTPHEGDAPSARLAAASIGRHGGIHGFSISG